MNKQFHELIHEAKRKGRTSQSLTNLRNYLNETYQQYEFLNMKNSFDRLIQNLKHLAKQENANSKCFVNVLNSPNKFSSSLLSLCENVSQILNQQSKIRISHQHHASQVIFLALFLKYCNPEKYITVVTSRLNFKSWSKYLIDEKSTDPQSDLKNLLSEQKINYHLIDQSYDQSITHNDQFLIFDLMNVEVIQYRPLLLKIKQSLSVPQKIIVYHSHVDQIQVQNVLQQINLQCFLTQASQTYPIEISYVQKDAQIKQKLIQFLKEDSNHPQKQDIIVFYKNQHLSNSTAKRFSHKLKQLLTQNHLQNHVQLIQNKNQILLTGKNHIFISQNVQQLLQWNYIYEDVLFVIDYGWNVSYRMDHERNCFVEGLYKNCLREKTQRLSFVGISKVGKYIYAQDEVSNALNYLDRARQLMTYTLRMINLGLSEYLQKGKQRVDLCMSLLLKNSIISKDQNNKLLIKNEQILKLNKLGVDPIQAKIVLSSIQKQKEKQNKNVSNLVLMTLAIINTRGNLRQIRQNIGAHISIKPTGIWRKTGYLDSCLQILTKAQIIQSGKNNKKSLSKRSASKVQEQFMDGFGSLFDAYTPIKVQFHDMKMDDLLRQYFVSDTVFAEIRNNLDQMRDLFNIQQTNVKLDQTLLNQVIQTFSNVVSDSVAIFSGSRRLGYRFKNQLMNNKKSIFPNRQSLLFQLNQTPQFVLVLRCVESQNKKQILMCNTVNLECFMTIFGQLPAKKNDSLAEYEIQFHGISSGIFKGLFRNNGIEIQKFEQENKCFIEPNQEMATITIYCSKQKGPKIKEGFQQLISKIKQKFINYNKIINYEGNTNISMSNGGQIKQIFKDNYINKCYLNNLDLQVTQEDIQDLVDGFFILKSIQIQQPQVGKFCKSAIIEFNSQKDYYRFYNYYNQIKYFDRMLDVKPIAMNKAESIQQEYLIDFKWYVWRSHQKAIVVFKNIPDAQKALQTLKQNPLIDGAPVQFSLQKNKLTFNNLHQTIDQIFLEKAFAINGQIQTVQILKTPLKEPPNQQIVVDSLIKDTLQIANNAQVDDKYKIYSIEKHKNGLRKCRVLIKNKNINNLQKLVSKLNGVKGKIGECRLYTQTIFTKPILIAHPTATHLYQTLLNQTINKGPQKQNVSYIIKDFGNHRNYIIVSSPMIGALTVVCNQFQNKLKPQEVKLTTLQKSIILSEVGIANLIDLQEKFNCKIVVNSVQKTLQVICRKADLQKITAQINSRVQQKFFYRISLNTLSYKNLSKDKQKLQQIKKKYFLTLLQIQEYSKTLIFEGSANHVQNALNYMMHLIQSFSKPQDQLINTEVCLICYEQPTRPYRLQNCGHKFCFGCLDQCINSILGDITMFPIKCPHCMKELTIDDLQSLIERGSWNKLINMGVTQFVNKNSTIMTFCYTPGCKQINMLKHDHFKCDKCAASYCLECKQRYHQGLTCEDAKNGVDALFQKYMKQNDVRVCPNTTCKMPIIRTDGCYRVTCSRCNKSMCFKCPADKMIAYNDYNQCYKHLNDAHGGYW